MAHQKSPYQIDQEMKRLAGKVVADTATQEDWNQFHWLAYERRQRLVRLTPLPQRRPVHQPRH